MGAGERLASQEELVEYTAILSQQFIQRRDLFAKQLEDGRYICVRQRLGDHHLVAHLEGKMTLGAYLLDEQSQGRFLVLDADGMADWRRLQALSLALNEQGAFSYLEASRRGGHLWLFMDEPRPGQALRRFGRGVLQYYGIDGVELFPKQNRLTSGPGSLIRLPFGIHQKSGRRYGFYVPDGKPLAPTLREQIQALSVLQTVPETVFEQFAVLGMAKRKKSRLKKISASMPHDSAVNEGGPISERLKAAVTVRSFVERYVELSPSGRGRCPFHDDQVASFSVNSDENYWHCFGCNTGGSIIDYWMRFKDCDFKTAIGELARLLLTEEGMLSKSEDEIVFLPEDEKDTRN